MAKRIVHGKKDCAAMPSPSSRRPVLAESLNLVDIWSPSGQGILVDGLESGDEVTSSLDLRAQHVPGSDDTVEYSGLRDVTASPMSSAESASSLSNGSEGTGPASRVDIPGLYNFGLANFLSG